jgi:hypothetical protein
MFSFSLIILMGNVSFFPDNPMGPDLLCLFQDAETEGLILLVLESKLLGSQVLESVNPQFFYTVSKHGGREQYAPSKYDDLLRDVVDALGPKLGSMIFAKNLAALQK